MQIRHPDQPGGPPECGGRGSCLQPGYNFKRGPSPAEESVQSV